MPGSVIINLYILLHLILKTVLCSRCYYYCFFTDEKSILISNEATVSRAFALTLPYLAYLLLSNFCLLHMAYLFWDDTMSPGHPVMIRSLVFSCREALHMYQRFLAHLFLLFLYPRKKINFLFTLWPCPKTSRKQRARLTRAGSSLPSPPAFSPCISQGSPLNPKWDEL